MGIWKAIEATWQVVLWSPVSWKVPAEGVSSESFIEYGKDYDIPNSDAFKASEQKEEDLNLKLKKFCNGASRSRSMFSHTFLAVSTFSTCNLNASSQTPTWTATDPKAFCHPTTPQKTTKPVFNTPSFSRTYLALNIIDSTIVNSLNYLSNRNLSFPPLDPMAPVPRPNRHLNLSKWLQTHANYLFATPCSVAWNRPA